MSTGGLTITCIPTRGRRSVPALAWVIFDPSFDGEDLSTGLAGDKIADSWRNSEMNL